MSISLVYLVPPSLQRRKSKRPDLIEMIENKTRENAQDVSHSRWTELLRHLLTESPMLARLAVLDAPGTTSGARDAQLLVSRVHVSLCQAVSLALAAVTPPFGQLRVVPASTTGPSSHLLLLRRATETRAGAGSKLRPQGISPSSSSCPPWHWRKRSTRTFPRKKKDESEEGEGAYSWPKAAPYPPRRLLHQKTVINQSARAEMARLEGM
ncbi:hypothetical protein L249_3809 [Ophiocordyceps polyrhachis-furcata BCC 54312]|uniref:Uncharacterized protein n=1 Tax=Ophiocordyceps polyrhachis-furcata BCC 54312 TaxID=1330021 RepID=A0A367L5G4_9HYPO|nr:hypothetical protein L249_3809 [Ophiocordyceps polyrhachis-furcata BCC 54312]